MNDQGDEDCLLVIRRCVRRFRRKLWGRLPGLDNGDLAQAAWFAVPKCRRTYRPELGVPFGGYLYRAAWRAMSRCVAKARMISVPPATLASSHCAGARECHGAQAARVFNAKLTRRGLYRVIDHRSVKRDDDMDLETALAKLEPRERLVLALRYGLGGREPHTLEDIGSAGLLGRRITKERVRQLEARAVRNLGEVMGAGRKE